jgi:hypothetical protein
MLITTSCPNKRKKIHHRVTEVTEKRLFDLSRKPGLTKRFLRRKGEELSLTELTEDTEKELCLVDRRSVDRSNTLPSNGEKMQRERPKEKQKKQRAEQLSQRTQRETTPFLICREMPTNQKPSL